MSGGPPGAYFLFATTTQVLWAEEVAQERGIPVEVVPAPPGRKDLCGLALRTTAELGGSLEEILAQEGVPFQKHG